MTKGYVYILSNPSFPGLIKIGKTTRSPEQRANELWSTGVPTPFNVDHEILTPNCHELEEVAHQEFHSQRVSPDREFFRLCPVKAFDKINEFMLEQIRSFISEYSEVHSLVEDPFVIDEGTACSIAHENNVAPYDLIDALRFMQPEQVKPLMDAYFKDRDRRRKIRDEKNTVMPNGAAIQ